jgi:hypothetical protein
MELALKLFVRVGLVAGVVYIFFLFQKLMLLNDQVLVQETRASMARLQDPPATRTPQAGSGKVPRGLPWRRLAGAETILSRGYQLNGVDFHDVHYTARTVQEEIIDEHRFQLQGRGWRETTETFFNLDPEQLIQQGQASRLQSASFSEKYESIMNSMLVMKKGRKTVLLNIIDRDERKRRTRYSLTIADTPSVKELWLSRFSRKPSRDLTPHLEMSEEVNGKSMRSLMFLSTLPPEELKRQLIATRIHPAGWRKGRIPIRLESSSGGSVETFTRHDGYAILNIIYDRKARTSTALLTTEEG